MAKQMALFGKEEIPIENEDNKYTKKVTAPVYKPRKGGTLYACYDQQKYLRLVRRIEDSNVSNEEKKFLIAAASRFIEFNYENIADYYAQANAEMQELMEKLALVIIDFDKAIENGLVKLNDNMRRLYELELE